MKKFEGMLFCTDLDGTLFDDNKKVSKENVDAIEYFKSNGGLFTFISGRVPQTSEKTCEIIKPNAPYGCINGGGIYDPIKKKYLWNVFLPKEAMELVRAVDKELPEIGIQFNTEKEVYFNKDNPAMVRFRQRTGLSNVYRHFEEVEEPILKVVFAHNDEEQITALKELLNNHPNSNYVNFIRSEFMLYEILPKGVSKGTALKKMTEILNIDASKTIAVGDYYNDVSMLKMAKCGIAVSNAVDDVKMVADYTTVTNNENAIAVIIEALDNGKISI